MEPELEPGFDLNYPVPLSKVLPGFSGSGLEPGSITNDAYANGCTDGRHRGCCKKNWTSIIKPYIDVFYGYINVFN